MNILYMKVSGRQWKQWWDEIYSLKCLLLEKDSSHNWSSDFKKLKKKGGGGNKLNRKTKGNNMDSSRN